MPRQVREDLSYFTLDCDIFSKKATLRPLLRKFKADGLAVYIHILCDVYGTGYYFKPEDYEGYLEDLAEDCGITVEKVQLILAFMADRTLLDAFSLNKNTVFTSHGIQKRYAQAMKGRKRSVAEIKGDYWLLDESEEAKIDTFYKSQSNEDKSEKNSDKSEKNSDKSEIYSTTEQNLNNQKETYNTPPKSPQGEQGEGDKDKAEFMKSYPLLAAFKSSYDDSGVDYKVLTEMFSKSERLRKTYSMRWVCANYQAIASGAFTDSPASPPSDKKDDKRKWELWLSDRRNAAEELAENALARATADSEYAAIYEEIRELTVRQAFAEVKDKAQAVQIAERLKELEAQGDERLKELGIDKADLTPRYSCNICKDTGYTFRGYVCESCYRKFKEQGNAI